jgi:hypothetical protein
MLEGSYKFVQLEKTYQSMNLISLNKIVVKAVNIYQLLMLNKGE